MSILVHTYKGRPLTSHLSRWERFVARRAPLPLSRHPAWLVALAQGLQQLPYCLEAVADNQPCGLLPLVLVRSWLFGRFLVSLPYLNHGGVLADNAATAQALIDRAVVLAEQFDVRYLELRQAQAIAHPALQTKQGIKVNMGLALPATAGQLWSGLAGKVRNQVRKAQKIGLTIAWGRQELLPEFYAIFCQNMRDLGTPVYSQQLFRSILEVFPERAELAVVRVAGQAAAAALLLHGWGISEIPSASVLRSYRPTNANMFLYWHLLERAVQRRQVYFDFGRSNLDSSTYHFKKQWGAVPEPANWQYYLRQGDMGDMRRENPKYQRWIRLWQRLPVRLTRLLGPWIVRGIP